MTNDKKYYRIEDPANLLVTNVVDNKMFVAENASYRPVTAFGLAQILAILLAFRLFL